MAAEVLPPARGGCRQESRQPCAACSVLAPYGRPAPAGVFSTAPQPIAAPCRDAGRGAGQEEV